MTEKNDLSDLYKQKDLIDKCKVKNYDSVDGYGRPAMIKACLPKKAELETNSIGSYDGKISFVIKLDDEIWLHNDYFGTCSGCDGFISKERSWVENMLRKAYCFDTIDDAIEYLQRTEDRSWKGYTGNLIKPTIETLKEMR